MRREIVSPSTESKKVAKADNPVLPGYVQVSSAVWTQEQSRLKKADFDGVFNQLGTVAQL